MNDQNPDKVFADGFSLLLQAMHQMCVASFAMRMTSIQEMMQPWMTRSVGARAIDHVDVSPGGEHRVIYARF